MTSLGLWLVYDFGVVLKSQGGRGWELFCPFSIVIRSKTLMESPKLHLSKRLLFTFSSCSVKKTTTKQVKMLIAALHEFLCLSIQVCWSEKPGESSNFLSISIFSSFSSCIQLCTWTEHDIDTVLVNHFEIKNYGVCFFEKKHFLFWYLWIDPFFFFVCFPTSKL